MALNACAGSEPGLFQLSRVYSNCILTHPQITQKAHKKISSELIGLKAWY
jgi:hypothetical protein